MIEDTVCTCEPVVIMPEIDVDIERFTKAMECLINRNNVDTLCGVPDYILSSYLVECLSAFVSAHKWTNEQLGVKNKN